MKKLFNVVIYVSLIWAILSAIYISLPAEYQEVLPVMNLGTAIIGGGTTLLTGTGGLAIQSFLNKTKQSNLDLNKTLVEKLLTIKDEYNLLKNKVESLEITNKELTKLVKIDLKSKLDNPMLTKTAKEMIEGVINEEKLI